ncbi:methyltransferase domain-containing protein [Rossellomorea vietnamensis]|uniref:Methyltransferase domain-containing protein n=1 Tax=Rossellomorea vietnamensis TaxID=218284 RepID=A0A5D4MBN8_9BACI|nr:methyltransferase domain-containing protein [Rossellomorea vietnamensis]TYR98908.1 methyltransferase domain-containing protein [Rossellomorea vietnamensis]
MSSQEKDQLGQFIPLHYHFQMLSDRDRVQAFRMAIERIVKPEHRVVELGSGTGVLSFFAAKQGAKVQSIEFNPALVEKSRALIKQNGMGDRVEVLEADASQWIPSEPVDVVVCEMLHSALLREKQVEVIEAFRKNHKEKFGKIPIMIPSATLLGVQPVLQEYSFEGYHAPVPLFQSPYTISPETQDVHNPEVYHIIDYDHAEVENYSCHASFSFQQEGEFNAFRFITKNLLASDPHGEDMVDWHNQYLILPTEKNILVKAGQTVSISFSYTPGDSIEVLSQSLKVSVN